MIYRVGFRVPDPKSDLTWKTISTTRDFPTIQEAYAFRDGLCAEDPDRWVSVEVPLTRETYRKMHRCEYTVQPFPTSHRSGDDRAHTSAVRGFHWGQGVFINDNNDLCHVSDDMDEDGDWTYVFDERNLVRHYGPPEPYFQGPKVPPMQGPVKDQMDWDDPCHCCNRDKWDRDHPSCPNWIDWSNHWETLIVDDWFNCDEFDLDIQCAPPERWDAHLHGRGETWVIG